MAKVRAWSMAAAAVLGMALPGAWVREVRAAELPEPAVGGPGYEGDYLRMVHQKLHSGWADSFIRMSSYKQLGPASSQRETVIAMTIRWDGTLDKVDVVKSSGAEDFDAAALNVVALAGPFPPPVDVMADDGVVHLKWHFARNHRLCSGAEIVHVEYPLQIALPSLAARGQLSEAVRRMNEELYRHGWSRDFLTPFIRQWLARSTLSTELDTRSAAALALGGDRHQIRVLQTALLLPQTAAVAVSTLDRLGINAAALLAKALAAGEVADATRSAVLIASRAVPSVAARCPTCLEALAAAVVDPRQPAAVRAEMITTLGQQASKTETANQALAHAANDPNPTVRAAALLAQIAPGRGRVGVIRMAPLLHHAQPEIRAAAAAGVLRAGGDLGVEQLYLLGRETDPRPLIAAATELGQMSTEASLELLRKLMKRTDPKVRTAVVSALLARRDPTARELVQPILQAARANAAEEASIRLLALPGASPTELLAMSNDARLALPVYRAMLRAQLRQEAAQWLLRNIEQLSPEDRVTAFGDWIAEQPKPATTAQQ